MKTIDKDGLLTPTEFRGKLFEGATIEVAKPGEPTRVFSMGGRGLDKFFPVNLWIEGKGERVTWVDGAAEVYWTMIQTEWREKNVRN